MHKINLPFEYAIVLQQVDQAGEEDFITLAEALYLDKARLSHILKALKHKGLIRVNRRAQETWISLSARGQRLIAQLIPEAPWPYNY
jgi:DNA-binding MarR family transcriptional regulator